MRSAKNFSFELHFSCQLIAPSRSKKSPLNVENTLAMQKMCHIDGSSKVDFIMEPHFDTLVMMIFA